VPARRLGGDLVHALGEFGWDGNMLVAEPRETPRQTMRMGRAYNYAARRP
jgi:hypothetical protein